MAFFNIPQSVKLGYLPFSQYWGVSAITDESMGQGLYTFKRQVASKTNVNLSLYPTSLASENLNNKSSKYNNYSLLNICPTSIKHGFKEDLANQMLQIYGGALSGNYGIELDDILQCIPSIQIREFLPDSRLDQLFDMFTDIFGSQDESNESQESKITDISKRIFNNNSNIQTKLCMLFEKLATKIENSVNLNEHALAIENSIPNKFSIVDLPFNIYTRLQKAKTTNFYELPVFNYKQSIYQSDGTPGWSSGSIDIESITGMLPGPIGKLVSSGGIIGNTLKTLTNSVGINMVKWWDAKSGSKVIEPALTIELDLFNDEEQAAVNNFVFITQLIGNNKWIQYNIFRHSSNLYDIKFPWLNKRLFMCTGKFEVTAKGVMRRFSFHDKNDLLEKLRNKYYNGNAIGDIYIPDVYHVKLTFQSLLPDNFNTYMFGYAIQTPITNVTVYDDLPVYTKIMKGIKDAFVETFLGDIKKKEQEILAEEEAARKAAEEKAKQEQLKNSGSTPNAGTGNTENTTPNQ